VILDLEPLLSPDDRLQPDEAGPKEMMGEIHGSA
jgi:hypothetical protein